MLEQQKIEKLSSLLSVMGNPIRLKIMQSLLDGEKSASYLVEATSSSKYNISQHLRLLLFANLIKQRKQGKFRLYSFTSKEHIALYQKFTDQGLELIY